MFRILPYILATASLCFGAAIDANNYPRAAEEFPLANPGNVVAHDPNILRDDDGSYYLFKGGMGITYYKAPKLSGPWDEMGSLLDGPSIIPKENRTRPWAPSVLKRDDTYYCFYTVSLPGSKDSAIGVATTKDIKKGVFWKDHGAIIQTKTGPGSSIFPFKGSNAIDGMVFIDHDDKAYLNYGSFRSGLWQVRLKDDLTALPDIKKPDFVHLADRGKEIRNDIEGSFMSFHDGYYYLWFSQGECCNFKDDFTPETDSKPYSIRVGRSKSARGPFVDRNGVDTTKAGGTVVYATNNDKKVFAPGGLGVLAGKNGERDVLYYHYLSKDRGTKFQDAELGYSYLEYVKGWPVAKKD
ncbi:hypothetical protein FQN50_002107 [Emmonsiellopsis sp. PD_5]|nr:hypothetical protein FQN50_002107 [Emmonsiellopsis sp. PD_5]